MMNKLQYIIELQLCHISLQNYLYLFFTSFSSILPYSILLAKADNFIFFLAKDNEVLSVIYCFSSFLLLFSWIIFMNDFISNGTLLFLIVRMSHLNSKRSCLKFYLILFCSLEMNINFIAYIHNKPSHLKFIGLRIVESTTYVIVHINYTYTTCYYFHFILPWNYPRSRRQQL